MVNFVIADREKLDDDISSAGSGSGSSPTSVKSLSEGLNEALIRGHLSPEADTKDHQSLQPPGPGATPDYEPVERPQPVGAPKSLNPRVESFV